MAKRKNKKDLLKRQPKKAGGDVTTLYLVRHGTTAMNEKFCFQGDLDIPLNELGRRQGASLTDYFADIPIDVGATSPLSRAHDTLDFMLAAHKDVPVVVEPGLTEMNFGIFEGRPMPEVFLLFPELADVLRKTPGRLAAPGGETAAQALERFKKAVAAIVDAHRGQTIAIATHGYVMTLWIGYVQGYAVEDTPEDTPENVAVSKFLIDADDHITIDFLNDDHHLTDDLKRGYDFGALAQDNPLFIYYPKCSTCKKAKKFLDEHDVSYISRDIVEEKLHAEEILALMARADDKPRRFFNTSGKLYREQGLKDVVGDWDEAQMADKLAEDGMLVKRPILVTRDTVLLGFKEDKWAKTLGVDA